jgi:sporulation protein YlmC with PRC-barrel domain
VLVGDIMELSEDELIGKTIMSEKGFSIGVIKKFLKESKAGDSETILVSPSKEIDIIDYKTNTQGDIIIPLDSITPIKDVVILEKNLS